MALRVQPASFVLLLLLPAALDACATRGGGRTKAKLAEPKPLRMSGVAQPLGCRTLAPGASLQAEIDRAEPGASFCLAAGLYQGPLAIRRPLSVWGPRAAIVRSSGSGTTISVQGPRVQLLGFTVDGSGHRFDTSDAAVRVAADDARVEGLRVMRATFGILVDQARRARIAHNTIEGDTRNPPGLRGDAIRLWETRDSVVEGNHVRNSRDVVVWYSPRNVLRANVIQHGRYGAHLMYSADNLIVENELRSNVVGVFVMYSRGVRLAGNRIVDSSGAAGIGIGLKESGNIELARNFLVNDTVGLYIDTSPLNRGDLDRIAGNHFLLSKTGVIFHGRTSGNEFRDNAFEDNDQQIAVEGGGDALASLWRGNRFDDYAGYDLDGDGRGDVPYRLRSLSADLKSRYPELAFFSGSAALAIVEVVGRLVPLVEPREVIIDPSPRVGAMEL